MSRPTILIAALSGRALAASARRAGFLPLVADCFGDADTAEIAAAIRVAAGGDGLSFEASVLLRALDELRRIASPPPVGLVLGSGFEDRPQLAARCADIIPVLGNGAAAIRRTKDPATFFPLLDRFGIAHPEVRLDRPEAASGWLAKRAGGSGGRHIAWCDPPPPERGRPVAERDRVGIGRTESDDGDRGVYFQRFAAGEAISLLAVASGDAAIMTGASRQWCAPAGEMPFRYGGAVGPVRLRERAWREMAAAARATIRALDLVGLVSADFLLGEGPPLLLEINPRPGATLDLFDDEGGTLFRWHVDACLGSASFRTQRLGSAPRAAAVLHADPDGLRIGTLAWPAWTADRPRAGARIAAGAPVCSVFGEGGDPEAAERSCRARMGALRDVLYARAPAEELRS